MTEYTCPFCGAFDQMGAVCEYCKRRLREEPEKQVRSILYACGKKVAVVYDDNEIHWLVNDKEAGEGMKVNTDCTDRFGRSYMTFSGYKSIDDVYLWLNQNGYSGYKFGVVIDCMPDEMCEPDKKLYVYFLDELMEEVAHYCDFYRVDKDTYKRRW